jgi:acetoin utilization protein AcuB
MIVRDIMATKLVTVAPDDTLSHAANLLRQYQFHHLPVVRPAHRAAETGHVGQETHEEIEQKDLLLLEGLLTSQDIDLVVALARQGASSDALHRPWQERHVAEVMHRATIRVTPATNLAAAAQILVERGLNCLPVVEYELGEQRETQTVLVGLLTRSDLLMALARSMGAFEPGMQLIVPLPMGDVTPLAKTLLLAAELHMQVRSVMAAPLGGNIPLSATIRLGTINPAPLLVRLQEAHIQYSFADALLEDELHA